jgi:hypothetical protein
MQICWRDVVQRASDGGGGAGPDPSMCGSVVAVMAKRRCRGGVGGGWGSRASTDGGEKSRCMIGWIDVVHLPDVGFAFWIGGGWFSCTIRGNLRRCWIQRRLVVFHDHGQSSYSGTDQEFVLKREMGLLTRDTMKETRSKAVRSIAIRAAYHRLSHRRKMMIRATISYREPAIESINVGYGQRQGSMYLSTTPF